MPKVRGNAAKQMPDAEEDEDAHVPLEETEAAATVDNKPEEDDVTAEGAPQRKGETGDDGVPLDAVPGTTMQQEEDPHKKEEKDDAGIFGGEDDSKADDPYMSDDVS